MNNWIKLSEQKPAYGQNVVFKNDSESDEEAVPGTYESHRTCMLGGAQGSMGEGFQDDYNKLPGEGNVWVDAMDFIKPEEIK